MEGENIVLRTGTTRVIKEKTIVLPLVMGLDWMRPDLSAPPRSRGEVQKSVRISHSTDPISLYSTIPWQTSSEKLEFSCFTKYFETF